jgi:membrane protein insertase Oxa1/YidC/SpoIIIJ
LWFHDLTVADPTYVLPVISALSMLATVELGTMGQTSVNSSQQKVRVVCS